MKTILPQRMTALRENTGKANTRLLLKFSFLLVLFFAVYGVLFHVLMLYEGRQYSWITGLYRTLTVM